MMIRKALPYEAQAVLDLYHSVIDGMANSPYMSERENLGFKSGDESEHIVLSFTL